MVMMQEFDTKNIVGNGCYWVENKSKFLMVSLEGEEMLMFLNNTVAAEAWRAVP